MSKKTWAVLALLGSTLFWGFGPVITKIGLLEVPTFSLAFLRNVLALVVMASFVLPKGLAKVNRSDIFSLLLIGLFGSGLNGIFFLSGLARTSATSSAAIFATVPLINAIAASLILKETPSLVRISGVIVGFLGSLLIGLGPAFLGQQLNGDVLGNLLVAGAAISWVIYIIGSKKLLARYPPLTIIFFSLLAGSLSIFPFALAELISHPDWYLNVGTNGFSSILYGGVISGVVAFSLFQWGMKYTSAFEAGMVIYLQPILTDIFALPLLGEKLSPVFLLGTVLILGGVFLATTYELIQKRRVEPISKPSFRA